MFVDYLGYLAAGLTGLAAIPQLHKLLKTKSSGDISVLMVSMTFAGILCWVGYGILISSRPLVFANTISAGIIFSILFLKLRYDRLPTISTKAKS